MESCNICEEAFINKFTLKRHLLLHAPPAENYSCDVCGKTFFRRDTLARHLRTHKRPAARTARHACFHKECKKTFGSKESRRVHMNLIHNPKPVTYKCEDCEKVYSTVGNLKKHTKSAHAGSLYECTRCLKLFRSPYAVARHRKEVKCAPRIVVIGEVGEQN